MERGRKGIGFSLIETMIAVAILAVGMIFIAGVFPLGIHYTTVSTERSIAAVVADEAFSKIRLHQLDFLTWPRYPNGSLASNVSIPFRFAAAPPLIAPVFDDFFAYPSKPLTVQGEQKQYYWSAICRVVDPNERVVQATVFVSRKIGAGTQYWVRDPDPAVFTLFSVMQPMPVWILAREYTGAQSARRELELLPDAGLGARGLYAASMVNEGDTIIDDATGEAYRVLERRFGADPAMANVIVLDRPFRVLPPLPPARIWVVPPPVGGGRNPCIGVFQKEIRF